MKRVLFVSVQYAHVNSGPGTFANYIAEAFRGARAYDLQLVSEDLPEPSGRTNTMHEVGIPRLPAVRNRLFKGLHYRRVIRRLEQEQGAVDLVWFNSSPLIAVWYLLLRSRTNTAVMLNDDNNIAPRIAGLFRSFWSAGEVKRWWFSFLEQLALHRAEMVVSNSIYLKEAAERAYGLHPNKVHVLYKAVDLSFFDFREPEQRADRRNDVRVLFAKRDYMRGGLETVLKGLSVLEKEVTLTVVGPGEEHFEHIRRLVRENGFHGHIELLGRVSKSQLARLYHEHDLFCVLSRQEALGVVFLEAMSSGLPVIGTNVGGIPEVLGNGSCGWLVSPRDPESFAETVEEALSDDSERAARAREARAQCARFSVQTMITRFEELLANATSSAAS
jgi:glycosyltransferase involved in cell wall biosynthesis